MCVFSLPAGAQLCIGGSFSACGFQPSTVQRSNGPQPGPGVQKKEINRQSMGERRAEGGALAAVNEQQTVSSA